MEGVRADGDLRAEERTEPLFDLAAVRVWGAFARRSLARHWVKAGVVGAFVVVASALLALSSVPQYTVTSTIITQSTPSLQSNSKLFVPSEVNSPASTAKDLILAKDNLTSTAERLDLVANVAAHRSSLHRWLRGNRQTQGERPGQLRDVVDKLRNSLRVDAEKDSVALTLTWVDPGKAVEILQDLEKSFFAAREHAEVGPRQASLGIINEYKKRADDEVARLSPSAATNPDSSGLRAALSARDDLAQRVNDAQLDVDAAEAAFHLRYSVSIPPELPRTRSSGGHKKLVVGGLFGALAAATCVSAASDLLSNKIVEPWQVSRYLGLPLIGELHG